MARKGPTRAAPLPGLVSQTGWRVVRGTNVDRGAPPEPYVHAISMRPPVVVFLLYDIDAFFVLRLI